LIGVVGGVGPYAGLDLVAKIFDQTEARTDQDHLPLALLSVPAGIPDRTEFLLGHAKDSPAPALARVTLNLEAIGATVVGIPCNSAHAPPIFDVIRKELAQAGSRVKLVHMIEEAAEFVRATHPGIRAVGVLSTTGTCQSGVYAATLGRSGMDAVMPDSTVQEAVHGAIYSPEYGIKAQSHPVAPAARERLLDAIDHLREKGADAIILGCTEIPLAITEKLIGDTVIVDPTLILARALIRGLDPQKLKPWQR
jgi:aspartate racemase